MSRYLDLSQKAPKQSHLDINSTARTNVLIFYGVTPDSVDHFFFCYLLIFLLFFIFKTAFFIVCICMYHGARVEGRGQVVGHQFFYTTMWVLGVELRSAGLGESSFKH